MLPLAFAGLAVAVLLLTMGISGASAAEVIKGQGKAAFQAEGPMVSGSSPSTSSPASNATPQSIGNFPASVNPVPGATMNRLDQGFDGTGQRFLAPFDGKVVYSSANDAGWNGGGYVAIQSTTMPSVVYYAAEGLTPTVQVGQSVTAGQQIATPRASPYNGIVGNFEIGLANPKSPGQPLAQVVSDPASMVLHMYSWLRGLGTGPATSTSLAGHP